MKEFKGEKKLKGDSSIDCLYCNGAKHFAVNCMLRKKEEKKNRNKDETYYVEKLEEVREKAKGLSLVARRESEDEESGTYQIWSFGSDVEEMRHPTHGAILQALRMKKKRRFLNKAKKLNNQLLKTQKLLDTKRSRVEYLEIQLRNVNNDRENVDKDLILKKGPDDRFAYGVVKIDEFLIANEFVNIVNESLTKDEQKKKVLTVLSYLSFISHLSHTDSSDDEEDEVKALNVCKEEKKEKEVVTKEVVNSNPIVKLNSNEFKVLVAKFSKEHKVSKRKARKRWKPITKLTRNEKPEVQSSENPKLSKSYISISLDNDVDLVDSIKEKVRTWAFSSKIHSFGCPRHMTGKKENLKDFRSLKNAGVVKFGNNQKCQAKGYGKITNGQSTVNRVAYVKGLQHNLISVSQVVVGTGNQVPFNEEGSIISNVNTKEVLLKSKMKGDMFTLDINSVVACDVGKQHKQGHPITIDSNIVEPLELLHIDLLKSEVAQIMIEFIKKMETTLKKTVRKIKSDHGIEFKNNVLDLCFIMNLKDNLSKFQPKADEGIFLGYSHNSVAYRVLNKRTRKAEETLNLKFDDYYIKQTEKHFENHPIL
ncbi:uncharacterized protein LOC111903599 [Lactuca sativa]|uniref:uncharacterized protein LOC111903599 n=1 Tax=Lactuca sativa TaxID=4236 RepID=UPI0022AE9383|nr:uncharacterized protein LOC111903599 [Lactuca sativa]